MIFAKHSNVEGQHSFLSASNYHWINYDEEKLLEVYSNHLAKLKGTELHEFAQHCIRLRQKLEDKNKTLNMYVNDAIGFNMTPEQVLYYSDNAFGTADAISFRNNTLRIHDLKTGVTPASMNQLFVYVAYFCLEYGYKPSEINIELRIYQNDQIIECSSKTEDLVPIIVPIMDKIVTFDKLIYKRIREELGLQ